MAKIAVVGGGIAGLVTALTINSKNHEFHIFERRSELKGLGAGLTLWPNANRVLSYLGLWDDILANSGVLARMTIFDSHGDDLMKIRSDQSEFPAVACHRATLHRLLVSKLSSQKLCLSSNVSSLSFGPSKVFLNLENTSADAMPEAFDLAICADGINSRTRESLGIDLNLKHRGYKIWRGLCNYKIEFFNGEYFEYWSNNNRFGILPLKFPEICWYATAKSEPMKNADLARAFPAQDFAEFPTRVKQIIENTHADKVICAEALDNLPPKSWSMNRCILIGDAIHPMTPNLGMGACMAIEDGYLIGKLINSSKNPESNTDEIFSNFQRQRLTRVRNVSRRARWIGTVTQQHNFVGSLIRNRIAKAIPGKIIEKTSESLYQFSL